MDAEFTLRTRIRDADALRAAAERCAERDGLTHEEWDCLRSAHEHGPEAAGLIMLLDPGSVHDAGIDILDSDAVVMSEPAEAAP